MALTKGYLNDYSSAIKDLDKAIRIDTNYISAYYRRAYLEDISGEYKDAVNDYKKVIAMDGTYREAYIGLATMMYQNGEKTKACEVFKLAAEKGSIMAEELINKICN